MERLYAPWRMNYVTGDTKKVSAIPNPTGCIFCDKPKENNDRANLIVTRGSTCYVVMNAFPYTNGHLLAVPYRHIRGPAELSEAENSELMLTAARMTRILSAVSRPDGYNIGMNIGSAAGAGIAAHLHLHVVPRWNGDTNFMPVLADVKVMPELLEQVYDKLIAEIERVRTEPQQSEMESESNR